MYLTILVSAESSAFYSFFSAFSHFPREYPLQFLNRSPISLYEWLYISQETKATDYKFLQFSKC